MRGIGGSHAQGRADRLPRHPHVGPALPGGGVLRRLHHRGGAGLDAVAPHHRRGVVRRRHGDAGGGQARPGLRPGLGSGNPLRRRHAPRAAHPRHRRFRAGAGGARAHQGRDVRERRAWRGGRRRADRAVPGRVLVSRRPARAAEAHQGRGDGDRRRAPQPVAGAASPRPVTPAGRRPVPALLHRRHPVSRAHRDPAHHRLGHHGLGQDGADLRPGGADPRPRRALRDLRQDGDLHPVLLRRATATC